MVKKLPDPPNETKQQKQDRLWRERKMLEDRQSDPYYDWVTGQVKARIEED